MSISASALNDIRTQFPITGSKIYFDIANLAPVFTGVTDTLAAYFERQQKFGPDKAAWLRGVEATRGKAARLLGCDAAEIAFTKNTSEGINIAANAIDWRPGDNAVLSAREHPNNVFPWLNLRRLGVEIRRIPDDGAPLDAKLLRPYIDSRTRVIAVADVGFHPGQRNDLDSLGALCRERGIFLVVDGAQGAGLLKFRPQDTGVSMWAAGGHKGLLSPHGIGLFWCRRDLIPQLHPVYAARNSMAIGAGDEYFARDPDVNFHGDARRFEFGNLNYSAIHAMGAALDLINGVGIAEIEAHVTGLAEYMTERLARRGIVCLGPDNPLQRSSICVFNLPGDGWIDFFAAQGAILSERLGAIRASIGLHNHREDVDRLLMIIEKRMAA